MSKSNINFFSRLSRGFSYCWSIYRYRVEITGSNSPIEKLSQLVQSFWRTFILRKQVLFFPDGHRPFHALCKALRFLGYRSTTDPGKNCNFAIRWWLAFDGNPFAPEDSFDFLRKLKQKGVTVLNYNCNDISKEYVNEVFEKVFGYPIAVDPLAHHGKCVMKLNWNALHKGHVIDCPVQEVKNDVVYQKLVNNETDDGLVEDFRVPVFNGSTPFVYRKYRGVKDRLVDRDHTNTKAVIAEVEDVLTGDELEKIHRFCAEIGMDCGEVDVLRDKNDRRIYIVDANNTPSGPPSPITPKEARIAVMRLAQAFENAFGHL
ncbi:MAG TPA: hypothetical protein EYP57_02240 [Thermodesulfobacteriaceae bacterium]|nr:hypothetical protein [Thermodesulfobacteriaceae bacterium]